MVQASSSEATAPGLSDEILGGGQVATACLDELLGHLRARVRTSWPMQACPVSARNGYRRSKAAPRRRPWSACMALAGYGSRVGRGPGASAGGAARDRAADRIAAKRPVLNSTRDRNRSVFRPRWRHRIHTKPTARAISAKLGLVLSRQMGSPMAKRYGAER